MLRLFGPVEVETDGAPPPRFRSQQTIALLGYLAVEQRPVAREYLAALFWANSDDRRRAGHLRRALHNLGTILPDCLVSDRRIVRFEGAGEGCSSDLQRVAILLERGDLPALREAVDLYRGDLLEGVSLADAPEFEQWLLMQRERWRHQVANAMARLLAEVTATGEDEAGLEYGRRLLALEPWREEVHRQVMLALTRAGRRSAAVAHYRLCCRLLAEQLDTEPEAETVAVYEQIRGATPSAHNLPPDPTPFVGRREEMAAIRAQLVDPACRLLTLVGLGGSGKSRLARAVARSLVERQPYPFLHGVAYVHLAEPAGSERAGPEATAGVDGGPGDRLAAAIGSALGLAFRGPALAPTQLLEALAGRELLLLLDSDDNRGPDRTLLQQILKRAPGVKVLVAARSPLRLREEHHFPVGGLSIPTGDDGDGLATSDAGGLLLEATRRLQPGFDARADGAALAAICRLTGGLPLGLELAAGWLRTLSPAQVARRLEEDIPLPPTDLHNVPGRHRSLRALFSATWQALPRSEQHALAALTVCHGSFSGEIAEKIAGASPVLLAALVQKGLLQWASAGRFQMHPLVRRYAASHLREPARTSARRRHALAYTRLLPDTPFYGTLPPRLLPMIKEEQENLVAAWQQALADREYQLLGRLAPALAHGYRLQGPFAAGERLFGGAVAQLLPVSEEGPPEAEWLVGWLLVAWTRFLYEERRLEEMRAAATRAMALAGGGTHNGELLAAAHLCRGQAHYHLRQDDLARADLEQALALQAGQPAIAARALRQLGAMALRDTDLPTALAYFSRARESFRESGDVRGEAGAANNLGMVAFRRHSYDRAAEAFADAASLFSNCGDRWGEGLALINQGSVAARLGDYAGARSIFRQALPFKQETGDRQGEAIALVNLSLTCHHLGRQHASLRHAVRAQQLARALGHADLEAYALTFRGFALDDLARRSQAEVSYSEALALCRRDDRPGPSLDPLAGLARLHLRAGRPGRALALVEEVLALAEHVALAEEPGRIWLTCYRVLSAQGDARAAPLLASACTQLRQQADNIGDAAGRQAYLQRVPYHRALLEAEARDTAAPSAPD